jgi:hypothetical protein
LTPAAPRPELSYEKSVIGRLAEKIIVDQQSGIDAMNLYFSKKHQALRSPLPMKERQTMRFLVIPALLTACAVCGLAQTADRVYSDDQTSNMV